MCFTHSLHMEGIHITRHRCTKVDQTAIQRPKIGKRERKISYITGLVLDFD